MTTIEQAIDRLAIFELTGCYADFADQKDWAALTGLFIPTAVFDAESVYGATYEGSKAILDFYENAPIAVSHHPTGVFTVFEGDRKARTRIKMLVLFRRAAFTVDYDWEVIKESETWRIAYQKITLVGRVDLGVTARDTEA